MREAADLGPLPDDTYSGFGISGRRIRFRRETKSAVAIPAAMAFLGLTFVCCALLVAGLPPLSGFLAKFALLRTAIEQAGADTSWYTWAFCAAVHHQRCGDDGRAHSRRLAVVLVSQRPHHATVAVIEAAPPAFLILLCLALTAGAGPVMSYLNRQRSRCIRRRSTFASCMAREQAAP